MNSIPDFNRNVFCILGIPFDAVSEDFVLQRILESAQTSRKLHITTPNLNFLISAQSDHAFRNSIINSNLSIADGMPVVWLAKFLQIPVKKRIAGSNMFESLRKYATGSISVFLLGGHEKIASTACSLLNSEKKGVSCAGYEYPGFGTIESMSDGKLISRINDSKADFLVLALGARKAQLWIDYNKYRIRIPVVCHLGAVLNFVACSVKRAPVWMQKSGLEWIWRIKEEPKLWRRYLYDGLYFLFLIVKFGLPHKWYLLRNEPRNIDHNSSSIEAESDSDHYTIHVSGAWTKQNIAPVRQYLEDSARSGKNIRLNLEKVTYVDSHFIGLLVLLYGYQMLNNKHFNIISISDKLNRLFEYSMVDYLLM